MTERKHRIEDALEAVRSAQEEGVIGGGGTATAFFDSDDGLAEVRVRPGRQPRCLSHNVLCRSCCGSMPDVANNAFEQKVLKMDCDCRRSLQKILEQSVSLA